MSYCYHLLLSLQGDVDKLCNAAGEGRLEDVKMYLQAKISINGRDSWVSNFIYIKKGIS